MIGGISKLVTKSFSYLYGARPITLHDYATLIRAFAPYASNSLRGVYKPFDCYLVRDMIVRTWDDFMFYVRARTSDLYTVCCEEIYELESWFKPLARGVVVDVGAHIGKYTVRAMKTADLVIAMEPLKLNFKVLQKNVKLNNHRQRGDVILVNEAIAEERKDGCKYMFVPVEFGCIEAGKARLGIGGIRITR